MKIKISSGKINVIAELKNTPTANAIYNALPLEAAANRWGDEIYFPIPVSLDEESDAKDVVSEGDVAYWPEGSCFCIFWGRTPASKGDEIRAASKVNVFGKIILDAKIFSKIKNGDLIVVSREQ
ncbi:hypothetical protein HYX02_00870 [Candidatus Woesearchaeota archaeon]|nr:hypothetical protein [Candidatus Woesearchaeota archaeon]